MDINHGVDDCLAVRGRKIEIPIRDGDAVRRGKVGTIEINRLCKLCTNLEKSLVRPVSEPVQDATIEKSRTGCSLGGQAIFGWVHGEDDMEVLDNLLSEPLI